MVKTTTIDGSRFYYHDGEDVAYESVTTWLSRFPNPTLQAWKDRTPTHESIAANQRALGDHVHARIEEFFAPLGKKTAHQTNHNNIIAESMFQSLLPRLRENITSVVVQEIPLLSTTIGLGGRCDMIGNWKGELSVIDFKTTRKIKKVEWLEDYFIQEACYAMMYKELYGVCPKLLVTASVSVEGETQLETRNTKDILPKVVEKISTIKPRSRKILI